MAAAMKVFSSLGRMLSSKAPLIQVLCRIWKVMSNVPNVKDRGNSCVVMDKRLRMTRHVGDSVSMVTRDPTTRTVCEERRTEDVEAEKLGKFSLL